MDDRYKYGFSYDDGSGNGFGDAFGLGVYDGSGGGSYVGYHSGCGVYGNVFSCSGEFKAENGDDY